MGVEEIRQTWVEIDLDALAYNIESIKEKAGKDRAIIGVVKADAYGHGAVQASSCETWKTSLPLKMRSAKSSALTV